MSTTPIVTIGNTELTRLDLQGKPVITLAMMDLVHERAEGTARKRFNDHKEKLVEGEDYFVRNSDEAKSEFGITAPNGLTLLTESGYLLLVKSFTDDLAWQVQRQLVKSYFGHRAEQRTRVPSISQQLAAHPLRLRLLDALERERNPVKRQAIHDQLTHASNILGLSTPAIDQLGYADLPQSAPAIVTEFWEAYDYLNGAETLNHANNAAFIGINLTHFGQLAQEHRLKIAPLIEYRRALPLSVSPKYLENRVLHSRITEKAVRCWVFEAMNGT